MRLGEEHPKALFDLTLESLSFNDPYVPERLLAASYGVCMRCWAVASPQSPLATSAAELALSLVEQLLRPSAPHFTWHTLARGYAIGVVELARKMRPRAIPRRALDDLYPDPALAASPFRPFGQIRLDDTKDGDHAIHMDFGNYTMGHLIVGRGNYDMQHREYRQVRRQIEDRIRRLGYGKDLFGETDRQIGHSNWREQGGHKTDRYGKKYSWIAFFEMYGLREALGLLRTEWHDGTRTSDCDLDPSFPSERAIWVAPLKDVFTTSPTDPLGWLTEGDVPDYRDLLDRTEVDGVTGGWVLLDATIRREGSNGRELIGHVASVMSSASRMRVLRSALESGRNFGHHGIPEGGADFYTYLGEVPWSLKFGSDVRTASGRPRRTSERAFSYFDKGWKAGIPVEATSRRWAWESHHSALNQNGGIEFPAPPLADFLQLRSIAGSADLIDHRGRRATLYRVAPGPAFGSHYLYIRRDLLDRYLVARKLKLVRALWGERTLAHDFFDGEISDEMREPFVRHLNTFRFADCAGDWLELGPERSE